MGDRYGILMAMKRNLRNLSWPHQIRRLPWLLLIPLGFSLPRLAARYPLAVEWYAERIYPHISGLLGAVSGLFPFSLAEFILYAAVPAAAGAGLAYLFLCLMRRIPLVKLTSFFLTLAIASGVLLNAFYLAWGFNYTRPTLYQLLDLPVRERPAGELKGLCQALCLEAASLRTQVMEDEKGVFTLPGGYRTYLEKIPRAYQALGQKLPLFSQEARPAKGVIASEGLSRAGIAGIYIPYTAEANVNVHQPPLLLLSSAAHETAHYLGVAKEDEANFVAYLACVESDDPSIAYSGAMLALINCANKLFAADPAAFLDVRRSYSEGMVRDILHYNAYWERYEGAVEEIINEMNDSYLKHNRQENGVKSYGLMVDLLLAWHFHTKQ